MTFRYNMDNASVVLAEEDVTDTSGEFLRLGKGIMLNVGIILDHQGYSDEELRKLGRKIAKEANKLAKKRHNEITEIKELMDAIIIAPTFSEYATVEEQGFIDKVEEKKKKLQDHWNGLLDLEVDDYTNLVEEVNAERKHEDDAVYGFCDENGDPVIPVNNVAQWQNPELLKSVIWPKDFVNKTEDAIGDYLEY